VREYSPVYSLWRAQENPKTGVKTKSLLWNLYRSEVKTEPSLESDTKRMVVSKKVSFFFGLFQSQSSLEGRRIRLFYIPFGKANKT
jgi:hypothetical protein